MFETKDPDSYYSEAVKDAVINNRNKNNNRALFLILNLSFVGIVSFLGFYYFTSAKPETKVLGVTHIAEKDSSNIDFTSEIEKIDQETSDSEYSTQLKKYIDQEINQQENLVSSNSPNSSSNSSGEITIVVKKGDTLASLAKRYYNDASAYELIIENNKEAFQKSHTIYPGQVLKISQRY